MALLTFLSDFGEKDHYVAAVKAAILAVQPTQQMVDISHHIHRHDIGHAAYVIRQVYTSFSPGTVHLIAVDPVLAGSEKLVALELNNHFFVGHDSGIYHLIHAEKPISAIELPSSGSTFPARDVLGAAAAKLANGARLDSLGAPIEALNIRMDRQLKATKREMVGQVIHVDHFGNLVTNISQREFDTICKLHRGNPRIWVRFARESFSQLHKSYGEVDDGDCFVLFNAYGFLEIGIKKGRAADLLGLKLDTPIFIEFNPE
jgi:hypothetical protein